VVMQKLTTALLVLTLAVASNSGFAKAASAIGAEEARARLAALVSMADDIYAGAKALVEKRPASEDDVDVLARGVGTKWAQDEHRFQATLGAMVDAQGPWGSANRYPEDVNEGFVRLGQFDNFIFAAFQKVYSCQNIQARFLINLSKRLLDHAHMAVAGHPDPDWNPEDLDGPSDKEACRPRVR
jgi:hypothetical protein